MPRVSVLTPIYRTDASHLRECIESILNQTFTDFEFLILNDSPDATYLRDIVKSYGDKRIKYIENDHNMGISASRNKLLKMARGEYIAIFDHDDISVPTRLMQQVEFLDANPYIGVVSGFIQDFGDKSSVRIVPEFDTDIKTAMTDWCCVWHTAAMVRKSVLDDNNIEYEEFYSPCEDYRLWSRLMDVTHFHNLQTVLVKYRTFENQTSARQQARMSRNHRAVQLDIINRFPAYYAAWHDSDACSTRFRLRLFGKIPLIKIKHNWVQLFEFIPLFKIWWR